MLWKRLWNISEIIITCEEVNKTVCIGNASLLVRELEKVINRYGDDFITVKVGNREYMIESIGHEKNYNDSPNKTHLCLNCKE